MATEFGWTLHDGGIALMWREGCTIRGMFPGKIKDAFDWNPQLQNLLLGDFFKSAVENCQGSWWWAMSTGVRRASPCPASAPQPFPSMTCRGKIYQPTSSRFSRIILELTLTNSQPNPDSLSRLIGQAMVAACCPRHTMPDQTGHQPQFPRLRHSTCHMTLLTQPCAPLSAQTF